MCCKFKAHDRRRGNLQPIKMRMRGVRQIRNRQEVKTHVKANRQIFGSSEQVGRRRPGQLEPNGRELMIWQTEEGKWPVYYCSGAHAKFISYH